MIHTQHAPDDNEMYTVEVESIYERENIADAEPDRAAALWRDLQEQFTIPTEFLFLPLVDRP